MRLTNYAGCHVPMEEKGSEGMSIDGEIFVGPTYADLGEKAELKE